MCGMCAVSECVCGMCAVSAPTGISSVYVTQMLHSLFCSEEEPT